MSESRVILLPGDPIGDRLQFAGGKARSLAMLHEAGFRVPEWLIILPDAFRLSLSPAQEDAFDQAGTPEAVRPVAEGVVCCAEVECEVRRWVRTPGFENSVFAVRSSANDEDGARRSFAGQLESFLFVEPNQLASRVAAVWRSGFSERVLAYRRQQGAALAPAPPAPAVLIQIMVDAQKSGVAFSADPVSGQRSVAVVSSVQGLGTALVSGAAESDTFYVKGSQVVARAIARKRIAHRRSLTAAEGVEAFSLDEESSGRPSLSDAEVLEVAALAHASERFFGRPQDIEWAFDSAGLLWLLQSRPITGLAALPDPEGIAQIWDNSNIAESYPGFSSPLTFSFARRAYEEVYRQFCRMMGVPAPVIAESADLFRHMLGHIHGRIYYNLLNWYRVLALLPGFKTNRHFMETMMGVRQTLPDEIVVRLSANGAGDRIRDAARLISTVAGLAFNYLTIEREISHFYQHLNLALGPKCADVNTLRPDELAAAYRDLESQLITRWNAPLVNDFFAMVFYGVLQRLCAHWCGDASGALQNDLLSAQGGMISTELAVRMRDMAAAADPALREILMTGTRRDVERAIQTRPAFATLYRGYLDQFGDRSIEELKLETSTLHDDPLNLFRSIGSLASRPAPLEAQQSAVQAAEQRVRSALSRHPLRRVAFGWILRNARRHVRNRENLRFERTRVFGRVRRIFVELGRRLYALDQLDEPRDIFWLEVEEALGFVEGTATSSDLRGLAALRRAEMARWKSSPPPPDRFETRGPVGQGGSFQEASVGAPCSGECMQGTGCCPGVVRGPVRFVRDPGAAKLESGDILLAERTDPGWVMLFPLAAGLIVERGSLLSHSAIVARELGIPTVVSLPGATTWLQDGEVVELNGSTGEVRKIRA